MRRTATRTAAVAAALSIAAVCLGGCKGGRIAQCNALIQVINNEQTSHKKPPDNDPQQLAKLADSLEQTANRIGSVELTDEKLKAYRDDYQKMAEEMAKAARDAATASDDPAKLDAAAKAMRELEPRESELVHSINEYCGGG